MTCERCGMYYSERRHSWDELIGKVPMGEGEPNTHECPEPLDPVIAAATLEWLVATGAVVSQRLKAQIKLALER